MTKDEPFGVPKEENFWEKYTGRWMLFKSHNDWEAGRLDKLKVILF